MVVNITTAPYVRRAQSVYAWLIIGRKFLVSPVVTMIGRMVHAEPPDFTKFYRGERLFSTPPHNMKGYIDVTVNIVGNYIQWNIVSETMHYYGTPCRLCFIPFCNRHKEAQPPLFGLTKTEAKRFLPNLN